MLVMQRADEHLVDLVAGHLGQQLDVVRIVRAGDDRLLDLGQVDLDHRGIFGVGIGLPAASGLASQASMAGDAALQRAAVLVAVGDHPLHQGDVGAQVLDDRLLVQPHRAAGGRTLGRGVGQLEGLLDLEIGQALDLQDAAGEDVLLALLLDRQQALAGWRIAESR